MKAYLDLVQRIFAEGEMRSNRTGTATLGVFGGTFTHDLLDGFPLLTTKKMALKNVAAELAGFVAGVTSAAAFRALGTKIWDQNANEEPGWLANPHRAGENDLGRIYGAQWRGWCSPAYDEGGMLCGVGHTDQLQNLIDGIKRDPYGRRHIVTAWNPGELNRMALPPCHILFQCYVRQGGFLDVQMHMRSTDVFLGLPYNIASYAMLTHLIAILTGLLPGRLMLTFGDLHIYEDHLEQMREQARRAPLPLPELTVRWIDKLEHVTPDIFQIHGYNSHPALAGKMAV